MAGTMKVGAGAIANILRQEGSGLSPSAADGTPQSAAAHAKRLQLSIDILEGLEYTLRTEPPQLEALANALGDGSRDVAWRLPFGESGLLKFHLELLSNESLTSGVKVHALRIIGNCCADTDENRARTIEQNYLVSIIHQLQDKKLIQFAIPVLHNILVDYEPAQKLASQLGLNKELVSMFERPIAPNHAPLVVYCCKIFSMLVQQDGEAAVASPQTVQVVLKLATTMPAMDDVDDFLGLLSTAATYLANESFQTSLLTGQHMDLFVAAFYHAHTHFKEEDDPDTAVLLKKLTTGLLTTLAELTGHDSFTTYYPLSSSVPQSFLAWLQGANPRLQVAACLALGNIARTDETSLALIQTLKVHLPLINTLSNPAITDTQQLHSTLSFLKNLAIPAQNKPLLGDLLEATRVPRILSLDTLPQVQFAAVSLARLLLVNCASNVRLICAPRSAEPSEQPNEHTSVHDILSLFDRADAEPTKLEAARCIASICRVFHTTPVLPLLPEWDPSQDGYVFEPKEPLPPASNSSDEKESQLRGLFYQKHDFTKALSFLVTQQKWPILRSEAWFVFALMSRSKDGARVIADTLAVAEATDALARAVTGQELAANNDEQAKQIESALSDATTDATGITNDLGLEPQQVDLKHQANMTRIDRENCLVLCTEIVKNSGGALTTSQLSLLQDLIRKGTEVMSQEKVKS
ncbi:armadillo-type protein [Dactylonectria estremocensis]|uniref:Armadillo-type protein n=1 Tax=Dactylonectria estremocensis TaxID=1079267 RepID=A0A9P9FBN6_9HYPO|nr:armadillo-type protein [Dactylonectria estremocensis]